MKSWLKTAVRKDVVLRGIKVGGVVGTILVAINQGDLLLAVNLPPESLWKILLSTACLTVYLPTRAYRRSVRHQTKRCLEPVITSERFRALL